MFEHHATVCISDTLENSIVPEVYKTQSSDISHIICDRFSIDDARRLSQDAVQKPINSACRVFVLVTQKLPEDSQNALLKLFEDPPEQTKFFVVLPQEGILIPTLRSRVEVVGGTDCILEKNDIFTSFLSKSFADRMASIVTLTKKKDVHAIEAIFSGAEQYVSVNSKKDVALLRTIIFIRGYSKTPGASVKMLLEELALTLPQA